METSLKITKWKLTLKIVYQNWTLLSVQELSSNHYEYNSNITVNGYTMLLQPPSTKAYFFTPYKRRWLCYNQS